MWFGRKPQGDCFDALNDQLRDSDIIILIRGHQITIVKHRLMSLENAEKIANSINKMISKRIK